MLLPPTGLRLPPPLEQGPRPPHLPTGARSTIFFYNRLFSSTSSFPQILPGDSNIFFSLAACDAEDHVQSLILIVPLLVQNTNPAAARLLDLPPQGASSATVSHYPQPAWWLAYY